MICIGLKEGYKHRFNGGSIAVRNNLLAVKSVTAITHAGRKNQERREGASTSTPTQTPLTSGFHSYYYMSAAADSFAFADSAYQGDYAPEDSGGDAEGSHVMNTG